MTQENTEKPDSEAGELDEAEEVAGFDFVASVDAPVAQKPGEESLYVPAASVTT